MKRSPIWIGLLSLTVALSLGACSDAEEDGGPTGATTGTGNGFGGTGSGGTGGGFQLGNVIDADVTPSTVVFNNVAKGDEASELLTVCHVGSSGTLKLSNFELTPASPELTLTAPETADLQPSECIEFSVIFAPSDDAGYTGILRIRTNAQTSQNENETLEVSITTSAPTSELIATPDPLDFGDVTLGTTETKQVVFVSTGSEALNIVGLSIADNDSGEFSIASLPDLPLVVEPASSFALDVAYTPIDGEPDQASLILDIDNLGTPEQYPVTLIGVGRSSEVELNSPIVFGAREAPVEGVNPSGYPYTMPLIIINTGFAELIITDIALTDWSSDTLTLTNTPSLPLTLQNNETAVVDVVFAPTLDMAQTTDAIGAVYLESNANDGPYASNGISTAPVYGSALGPDLVVTPSEVVDFSFVATGLTNDRTVTLTNVGTGPVTIYSVSLMDNGTNEFSMLADESFGPLASTPTSAVIGAGDYQEVKLSFTNNDVTPNEDIFATLRVESNDAADAQVDVALVAHRTDNASCDIQLTPVQSDYGIVPRGFTRTVTVNMTNVGSGPCSFQSAFVNDCTGEFFGFLGTSCPDPSETIQNGGDSTWYEVVGHPPAILNGLKPGESHELKVTFTPPETAPIFAGLFEDYAGFLGVRVIDPYNNNETVIFPKPQGGGSQVTWPSNLRARSGIAELSVFPGELDFSKTTIGCHSQTLTLTACNVGTADLALTDVELQGCSIEFKKKNWPGIPSDGLMLGAQGCTTFDLVYAPQDLGSDACTVGFYTWDGDSPTIVVPLEGEGVLETDQTDVFIQLTGQNVDVLFVVDNSGSMGEEQSNLSSNFGQFISEAATWQNDYHVGVTSMDFETDTGRLLGSPRYVDASTWQAFQNNVELGTVGSGTEQGLAAAQAALTLPNIADTSTPCSSSAECSDPEACFDGYCGGPNRGFLREDAALEIVFVSDEEDQSPADLNFYLNFFKSIKGFYNTNLFHAHAIVGPPGGCSSSNGDATAGLRYIDLANQTGGNTASICQSDFSAALASIGEIAFGLKTQFFLSRAAEPSTIQISVAGQSCSSSGGTNWAYDSNSNSVIFVEEGACMPQPGDEIEIYYETICYLE